jgi:predicted Rossmann-fold nucleotide-binding protein
VKLDTEELAEVLTWRQLGLISSPIAILNINNFFDPLILQLGRMLQEGFVKPEYQKILQVVDSPQALIGCIYDNRPDSSL